MIVWQDLMTVTLAPKDFDVRLNVLKVVGAQLTNKTYFYCKKLTSYEHLQILWGHVPPVPPGSPTYVVHACDRRCKIVDSCVGGIAGCLVCVEGDDDRSVCQVDMDSDDTVMSMLAGVEVVIIAEVPLES